MALIYLSSFWTPEGEEPAPPADAGSSAEYSQSLEQELSRIISAITGEKSPAVLVTLEDSGRSLYAEDGRSTTQQGEASSEERESTHVLFEDSQGNQQPLTITQTQPQVRGGGGGQRLRRRPGYPGKTGNGCVHRLGSFLG